MKKIFTLSLLAATLLSAKAADFELYFDGEPVTNGASYLSGYEFEASKEIDGAVYDVYKQDSRLTMKGQAGAAVTVTVVSNKTSVQFCGINGQCDICGASNGYTVTKSGKFTGSVEDLAIDKEYFKKPGVDPKMKEIVVDVTVTSDGVTKKITVTMSNTIAGVENVSVGEGEFARLVGRDLTYNVSRTTELGVYSITGVRVMSSVVSGHGSVALSNLPKGIYLYRLGRHSGKIVVR